MSTPDRRPLGRLHGLAVLGLALLLAGCATATSAEPAGVAGPGAPATVTPTRGDLTSTLVLAARVEARVPVTITAPLAGDFTVAGGAIDYVAEDGATGRLALPDGVEVVAALAPTTGPVPQHYPIAEALVADFALVADLDPAALYRLYTAPAHARGQVDEGPGPFDCPLADPVPSSAAAAGEAPAALSLVCVVPRDVRVFAGMTGVMAVQTGAATGVLMLPVEAVAGSAERGEVTVVGPDGRLETRAVELGLTDGAMIEIASGLGETDQVVLPAAGLRAAGS